LVGTAVAFTAGLAKKSAGGTTRVKVCGRRRRVPVGTLRVAVNRVTRRP
jgi:hypothetical protein